MGQLFLTFTVLAGRALDDIRSSLLARPEGCSFEDDVAEYHRDLPERLLRDFPDDVKMHCRLMDRRGLCAPSVIGDLLHVNRVRCKRWNVLGVHTILIEHPPRVVLDASSTPGGVEAAPPDPDTPWSPGDRIVGALATRVLEIGFAVASSHPGSCVVITGDTVGAMLDD